MLLRPIISLYITTVLILWIGSIVANGQSTPATTDVGWPLQIVKTGHTLVYYLPQIDESEDHKDPMVAPVEKLDVEFLVKTSWDLSFNKKKENYCLLLNSGWLMSDKLNESCKSPLRAGQTT